MNVLVAVVTTLAILSTFMVLVITLDVHPIVLPAMMACTAIWAAVDVGRLHFKDYDVAFPNKSILAVLFIMSIWIVGFPMFLVAWLSIVRKTAKRLELGSRWR